MHVAKYTLCDVMSMFAFCPLLLFSPSNFSSILLNIFMFYKKSSINLLRSSFIVFFYISVIFTYLGINNNS